MHTCIDVDVWCKYDGPAPTYRVYVDHEMLTERTFTWASKNNYIKEHLEVDIEPGWHEVRIENCSGNAVSFITGDVLVNGKAASTKFLV